MRIWSCLRVSSFIISVLLVYNSISCCFYFLVLGTWDKWQQCTAFAFERILHAWRGKISCVLRWQSTCYLFRWHYFNPELKFWLFYWKETGNYTSGWNFSFIVFQFWNNKTYLSSLFLQVNQGLTLGWCKLTFPDGQNQLIQIQHPKPYERYWKVILKNNFMLIYSFLLDGGRIYII